MYGFFCLGLDPLRDYSYYPYFLYMTAQEKCTPFFNALLKDAFLGSVRYH